ncbi:cyclophilin-like fold protein [Pseudomonas alvandae]|uniref:cyclophilin-like fold protein n=1 Tax=Pseudomonas canavaninivorans TaxID=2842348 RepID=UPI002160EF7B|nr:cyclophilin-like fold protein [Pseudomonas canavaninivorans]UVM75123.1 cyclophilin-like fold protein [Pseudomonas canavaninivorans]
MRPVWLGLLASALVLGSYGTTSDAASAPSITEQPDMWMTVGEQRFAITLTDNAATRAFVTLLPLTLEMSDLNRNEKYASLPQKLPAQASKPGTIHNGDLMLYGTDTLVVFYTTFDSTYAYTRLGHMDDAARLAQALGRRDVQVTFSQN